MPILIGDIHGCFKTFLALLKKLPNDEIIFTGDLIDRGPGSKEMVHWVLDHKSECTVLMGNHEKMMLNYYETHSYFDRKIWINNGGDKTEKSYNTKVPDSKIDREHFEFIMTFPLFLDRGDLFISHSCWCGRNFDEIKACPDYQDSLLWYRGFPRKIENKFHIYGHTPVKEPFINDYSANIDTGCVYGRTLTAIEYPSLKLYSQEKID